MQYLQYDVEDFLMEGSFQSYCLGKDPGDKDFWEAWIAAHPEKRAETDQAREICLALSGSHSEEQLRKDSLAFRMALDQYVSGTSAQSPAPLAALPGLPGIAGFSDSPKPSGSPALSDAPYFSNIQDLPELPDSRKTGRGRIWAYAGSAAAIVILLVLAGRRIPSWRSPSTDAGTQTAAVNPVSPANTHRCKAGEQKTVQLPDGSKVLLNAGSTFTIVKNFNQRSREILLDGEAFFDVAHDAARPFIIHTSAIDVKVLGTVFNVKAYSADKTTETSLLKGSVEVTIKNSNNKKIVLSPNEKIILANTGAGGSLHDRGGSAPRQRPDPYRISPLTYNPVDSTLAEVSWIENRLVFNENTFEEIATQLERWYGISIQFRDEKVKQYKFTATFDRKNITEILNALQMSRYFEYKVEGDGTIEIHTRT